MRLVGLFAWTESYSSVLLVHPNTAFLSDHRRDSVLLAEVQTTHLLTM